MLSIPCPASFLSSLAPLQILQSMMASQVARPPFQCSAAARWLSAAWQCVALLKATRSCRRRGASFSHQILDYIDIKRPTVDDVQRLSEGRAARSRCGYGSRQVPHRLNQEERQLFNIAKEKCFLTIRGSGYRRERKGSPLANIFRQLNDSLGRPCLVVEQDSDGDTVLLDLAPLRLRDTTEIEAVALGVAAELGVAPLPTGAHPSPFTVIVPTKILELHEHAAAAACDAMEHDSKDARAATAAAAAAAANIEVAEDPVYSAALSPASIEQGDDAVRHLRTAAIWQQPPRLVCFRCERPTAKTLARRLVERLAERLAEPPYIT